MQDILARAMAAIAAAMMVLVAWQSASWRLDQWDEMMASMNASAAWFIVAVGVGCAHAALHLALDRDDRQADDDRIGGHGMSLLIIFIFLGIAMLGMPLAFSLGIGAVAG